MREFFQYVPLAVGQILSLLEGIQAALTVNHQRVVIYDETGANPLPATVEGGLLVTPKLPDEIKARIVNDVLEVNVLKIDTDPLPVHFDNTEIGVNVLTNPVHVHVDKIDTDPLPVHFDNTEIDVNILTNPVHVHIDNPSIMVDVPDPLPVRVDNIVTVNGDVAVTGNVTAEVTGNVTAEVTGAVAVSGAVEVTGTVAAVCTGVVGIVGGVAVYGSLLDVVPVKVHVENSVAVTGTVEVLQPVQVVGSTLAGDFPPIVMTANSPLAVNVSNTPLAITASTPLAVNVSNSPNVTVANSTPISVDVWNGLHTGFDPIPVDVWNGLHPGYDIIPVDIPDPITVTGTVVATLPNPLPVTGTVTVHNQLRNFIDDTWRDEYGYAPSQLISYDNGNNSTNIPQSSTSGALSLSAIGQPAENTPNTALILSGHPATVGFTNTLRTTATL